MEGSTEGGEPVRRTRSGRLANAPKAGPKSKRTPVRGKKAAQLDQQDSDEEQQQLDNSDNEDSTVVISTEEEAALLEDNSATDNIVCEQETVVTDDVVGEDSNSVTNDFNSFKGAAESSSEHMGDDTNSFDVEQANSGEINRKDDADEEGSEPVVFKLIDEDVEMPDDPVEAEAPITNGLNPENPNIAVEEHRAAAAAVVAATVAVSADPEAENISEEEITEQEEEPKVEGEEKVVPEAEEVSDEELPGPKRAELPADTEVVSEDELPTVKGKGAKEGGKGKRKLAEGDYDPGSPTSESESAPSKKPALGEDGDKEEDEEPEKPKKLPELDKYWKAVNDDPTDFTGWTYLLQYVDQENDMEAAREAYDAFLSHYPYCYGYWRKYADYEKRKGNKKKCEEVFERGLKSIPLSVDLWIHYLTYVRASRPPPVLPLPVVPPTADMDDSDVAAAAETAETTTPETAATTTATNEDSGGEEYVRSQFERSLGACGLEFRSDRLWEHYIKWECEGKRTGHAMRLYERLLVTPTQGYMQHFENFQEHVMANPPNKVLEVDEFLALRKEVKSAVRVDAVEEVDNPDVPPGEDEKELNSDEETKAIRDRIVSIRRKMHKATVSAVQARWNYEEGIKRPYFHVKPLERCQLKNWQDYLDYEIEQGDKNRIIVLFERCLIACALYEEFWLRFVNFLNGLKDSSLQVKIKDVFERACTIHHLKKPVIHLQWAMFEESVKNYNKAAEILQNLDKTVPNILQVAYRRINLERRRGDFDKCSQLYEHYINNSKNKSISTNLAIKYARFLVKLGKNHARAIEVLNGAVTKDPNNSRLYLQLIDLSMHKDPIVESEVLEHINAFLDKDGQDADQKLTFSQRKLEFLEDFGSDIGLVQQAYEDYQKYVKLAKDKKKDSSKSESSKKSSSSSSTNQQQQSSSGSSMAAAPTQYGSHHGGGGGGGGSGGGSSAYNYHQSAAAAAAANQQQQQYQQHYQQQHQQQPQQQYGGQGAAGAAQYAQGYNQQGGGDQQYAQQYGGWQYPNSGYGGYNQWGTGYGTYGY